MVFGGGGATSGKIILVEVLNNKEGNSPQPPVYSSTKNHSYDGLESELQEENAYPSNGCQQRGFPIALARPRRQERL
jgi:hypothetical protein